MFEAKKAMFIYCVSPVHMGAGTALGLIDNPIQREKHTDYPLIAGSGLKGAIRHHLWSGGEQQDREARRTGLLTRLLGPHVDDNDASSHAGAVSFSDAQLVALPVRSLRRGFVYATSALALARAQRLLVQAGQAVDWKLGEIKAGDCRVADEQLLTDDKLILEAYEFAGRSDAVVGQIGEWLGDNGLPTGPGYDFFREKLRNDLVVLSQEDFGYFTRNAMVVEPHVRINDESGTADDGGLFYTENLPPESLLLSLVMASRERSSHGKLEAGEVLDMVLAGGVDGEAKLPGIDGGLLQVGGDATTGRGQMVLRVVG